MYGIDLKFTRDKKSQFIILLMHNLKANLDKFIGLTKSYSYDLINEFDNFQHFIPVPACQIAWEKRSKISRENFEKPGKDYSAVSKAYYCCSKFHLATSVRGVFASMNMSKTSVHDVDYLPNIKHSHLSNCGFIGDKGYLSKEHLLGLFSSCSTLIETLFSTMRSVYASNANMQKSKFGISIRILSRISVGASLL